MQGSNQALCLIVLAKNPVEKISFPANPDTEPGLGAETDAAFSVFINTLPDVPEIFVFLRGWLHPNQLPEEFGQPRVAREGAANHKASLCKPDVHVGFVDTY
ncbi:MAG TPA: hypothetical protein PK372_07770 [Rugosibacter sp.]|nr:hypothetical protein [Rugosibacter sp.]HQQ35806.1 hypothetical protein [Rugosibacter sp.]